MGQKATVFNGLSAFSGSQRTLTGGWAIKSTKVAEKLAGVRVRGEMIVKYVN